MGVPAIIKVNIHDQHAAAVIQYRLVSTGLLINPPKLPDVTDLNQPDDPLLVQVWEEGNVPVFDHTQPTTVQPPKKVQNVKLRRLRLRHLWEQSGVTALVRQEPYDYTTHRNNRDVGTFTLRTEHSPALHDEDRIHASMSWINSTRTLTWENETLNLRLATDTTHDPYSDDILAMRVDVARALEAIFLKLEENSDPFCDRDDIVLEEGNGLIPVFILHKLLYELDQRQAQNEEASSEEPFEAIFYQVTDKSQHATVIECHA